MSDNEMPAVPIEGAEERVKEALEKAELARRNRQYKAGIDLLLDALQYKVQVDMVFYRLGNLYFDSGDLARAEYAYRRAIETNPHHVNAHHNLSVVYKRTGRIHDSVRMRKRAARLEAGGLIGRALVGSTPPVFAKPVEGALPGGPGGGLGDAVQDEVISAQPAPEHGHSQPNGTGTGGDSDEPSFQEPYDGWDPVRDDPEGFRRFGTRVALAGLLVFVGVALLFLAAVYLIGFWVF